MKKNRMEEGVIYIYERKDPEGQDIIVGVFRIGEKQWGIADRTDKEWDEAKKAIVENRVVKICANTLNLFTKFPKAEEFLDKPFGTPPWPDFKDMPENPPLDKYPVKRVSFQEYSDVCGVV